jgi:alpha-galactosidase/6-phospho-beta-glucosidase family protein
MAAIPRDAGDLMKKIVLVGAGNVELTRRILSDLFTVPDLRRQLHIVLDDVDAERLGIAAAIAEAIDRETGAHALIEVARERSHALEGADFVICQLETGGYEASLRDFEIPHGYGLRQSIGDTIGIGGIFRGLRTIPVLVELAQNMADLCPEAWCLTYTDPMAMTTWAMHATAPGLRLAGLCHGVRNTHAMLADLLGRDVREIEFLTAGVNHQSFVLRFEAGGQSLYPELDERLAADPDADRHVRVQLYRLLGYFPTESSEHAAEYVPWFMRHDDQVARFGIPHEEYLRRSARKLHAYEEVRRALAADRTLLIKRQHLELASEFVTALLTDRPRTLNVTIPNDGLLADLPAQSCVEVPAVVGGTGLKPIAITDYPVQLAALNRTFLNVVELTVHAAVEQKRSYVYQAAALDPNTGATLALPAIHALCDDLIAAHGELIPADIRRSGPTTGPRRLTVIRPSDAEGEE